MLAPRFITIGDNCLDVYLAQSNYAVGGNALNVGADWREAGIDAQYIGAVGTDQAAELILTGISQAGLDPQNIVRLPGKTGVTFIRLDKGDRQLLFEEFGVGLDLTIGDEQLAQIAQADWVHVVGTNPNARITPRLVQAGARVSVDLSTYHNLHDLNGVTVAFASIDSAGHDSAASLARDILAAGAEIAVIMRGEHGSLLLSETVSVTTPAETILAVDTCGAGDSYIAAFVAAYWQGKPLVECMAVATDKAAQTCTYLGGWLQRMAATPAWLTQYAVDRGVSPLTAEGEK